MPRDTPKVFSMTAGLDLAALKAIDVHVHVESDEQGRRSLDDELLAASASYFKASQDRTPMVEQVAGSYPEVRPKVL
jgi:hypothetical protein